MPKAEHSGRRKASADFPAAASPKQGTPSIQVFELLPTFWRKIVSQTLRKPLAARTARALEAKRDATANRAPTSGQLRQYLAVFSARLNVEQVTRVKYCLSANRQPKAGEFLSYLHAQRGIENREPAGERIDGKHGRIGRKTQHGADVCAGAEVESKLQRRRLKQTAFEYVRGRGNIAGGESLTAAKRVAAGCGPHSAESARVNQTHAL